MKVLKTISNSTRATKHMNALQIISPYKYMGMWVFDDPAKGLDKEPFVAGADTIIDLMVAKIPDAEKGFRLLFSAGAFPGYQYRMDWVRPEMSGNIYRSADLGLEGWLCPALLKYFTEPPKEIYLQTSALPR